MTITWLGHSCFRIEHDGYQIITDPFTGVAGYPDTCTEAHAVYCSHEHFDHNYRAGVTLLPERESPFTVREIASFHDGQGGALRGTNTIRVFTAGGVSVCHLGDLGHLLSGEQAAAIGQVDVLLVPVPRHYRHAPYGLPSIGGVGRFLELVCSGGVETLPGPSFEVTDRLPEILVPTYR